MRGISTCRVNYAAIKLQKEELLPLPLPFITFHKRNGGTFNLVSEITDGNIKWYDTEAGWKENLLEDFVLDWSGVVLVAEKNEFSGEENYLVKSKNEFLANVRIPLGISLIGIVTILSLQLNVNNWNTLFIGVLLILISGSIISTLLLVKSTNNENEFVNKICNVGSKISCQSILDSPAAKINSWLTWSDLGFIYFIGNTLFLLMFRDNLSQFYSYHLIFSSIGIIFSFYSIYYQGFKAKIWCPLCLGVIALFWYEMIFLIINFPIINFQLYLYNSFLIQIIISILIPSAFLLFYKKEANKAQESNSLKNELNRLKSNPTILKSLMEIQPKMPFLPKGIGVVTIGNLNANNTLTIVSNPLCTPCSKMHVRIEEILKKTDKIKCQIVIITNPGDIDVGGKFARKVFSLPVKEQASAISSWYNRNDGNFENWNQQYLNYSEKDISEIFREDQRQWADEAQIKSTPTLFFNGFKLPSVSKKTLCFGNILIHISQGKA